MQISSLHNAEMERHERLKLARKKRFPTAKAAAGYLRMSYSTLCHHEAGTRQPKDDELAAYASAYRVKLVWLDHGEENLSPREAQLLEGFRALSADVQNFLLASVGGEVPRPTDVPPAEPAPSPPASRQKGGR
jgi:transcriptional regulator with XRE-family HTH domain